MYTQCPKCLTIYEIDEDALQVSLGIVHCGRCRERFDALRTLSDTLPEAPLTPLPKQEPEWRAPILTEAVPPSAYELAARRRRAQHGPITREQHELDLEAHGSPAPTDTTDLPRTEAGAEDWFADMESQLAAIPAGETTGPSTPETDALQPWEIESGAETEGAATPGDPADIDPLDLDVTPLQSITDDIGNTVGTEVEPAPNTSVVSPLATVLPEQATDTLVPDVAVDAIDTPAEPDAPRVVSPLLVEGDTFGADAEDAPVSAEALDEGGVAETAEPATTAESVPASDLPEPTAAPAHVYIRPRPRRSATGVAWGIGCATLALALAAQFAWASRVELVRDPATRAWAERVCRHIPCRLPPIKDTARLELLSRDVRPDPNAPGALTITATVRNDAAFRQPWPIVVVELTDFDNHPVAMRRFRPAEYMPDPARRATGIAPGATAALAFEVADPGKDAGGFRFGFE
ncbi:MAG: hypothetical protein OJF55_002491 [Rhodanobacteraceae bacterium]|jgi:predicted Zn finger-like uncharacterized protein|nr:MAG: hypothetical protein OJF55_002491 [Rhodanobacteraceae bacterium]